MIEIDCGLIVEEALSTMGGRSGLSKGPRVERGLACSANPGSSLH